VVLCAAQVPRALFADRGHELHRKFRAQRLQRLRQRDQRGKSTPVVADPRRDDASAAALDLRDLVGCVHGVEVGTDRHRRPRARAQTGDDVADLVDARAPAGVFHGFGDERRALRLREGRRAHAGDGHLSAENVFVRGGEGVVCAAQ
jgi:hypothetical protein